MRNAVLLWMITLALGICAQEAGAQQDAPKKTYKVIIREKGGEETVYEYNSLEALRADPRLKDQRLPGFEERDGRFFIEGSSLDSPFVLLADRLMLLRDSLHATPFRQYLSIPEGEALRESWHFFRSDSAAVMRDDVFKRLEELHLDLPDTKEIRVFMLSDDSLSLDKFPEAMQEFLQKRGEFPEGGHIKIFRMQEKGRWTELPPPPPLSGSAPMPPLPEGERPSDWLDELSVYPNPASEQLKIRLRSQTAGPALLRLLDMNGQVVYEEELPNAGLLLEKTIPVPKWKKGMYLLQLKQGNQTYSQRVLLQ